MVGFHRSATSDRGSCGSRLNRRGGRRVILGGTDLRTNLWRRWRSLRYRARPYHATRFHFSKCFLHGFLRRPVIVSRRVDLLHQVSLNTRNCFIILDCAACIVARLLTGVARFCSIRPLSGWRSRACLCSLDGTFRALCCRFNAAPARGLDLVFEFLVSLFILREKIEHFWHIAIEHIACLDNLLRIKAFEWVVCLPFIRLGCLDVLEIVSAWRAGGSNPCLRARNVSRVLVGASIGTRGRCRGLLRSPSLLKFFDCLTGRPLYLLQNLIDLIRSVGPYKVVKSALVVAWVHELVQLFRGEVISL